MWLVVLSVFVAVALLVTLNNKKNVRAPVTKNLQSHKHKTASPAEKAKANPYHAISICCEQHACAAAVANQDKRYLAGEVPSLPLPGCAMMRCACRYQHHDDRREEDRRLSFGLSQELHDERRECSDRRKKS
ncbi:hypothetical protein NO559_09760 [Dasania sp. GY-MA-18]|uniref:Uncharacterized protein n=1 Tax=Dasania phycosphaerae TaxID=2950436 RepID=A0A9J6RME3_9GAMM|nr:MULTISPECIES: hypothetical protein [Dasania]MCR8923057.1 hypothetical protein [Dasania sp. GY-MA-18]MCZ0865489.1 hypothetical protein [Dasania phycosphaerae]MCZ0869214.1 hypothetical protein [Dasania phycosphaerae]